MVYDHVDNKKPMIGMTNFKGDYFAEFQALEQIPMCMKAWIEGLDGQIIANRRKLLEGKGTISHKQAIAKAEKEFEIYRAGETVISGFRSTIYDLIQP